MLVGFGRTGPLPQVYQVVIEYLDEQAGRYAARAAVRFEYCDRGNYPQKELEQDLQDLKTSTEMPR